MASIENKEVKSLKGVINNELPLKSDSPDEGLQKDLEYLGWKKPDILDFLRFPVTAILKKFGID